MGDRPATRSVTLTFFARARTRRALLVSFTAKRAVPALERLVEPRPITTLRARLSALATELVTVRVAETLQAREQMTTTFSPFRSTDPSFCDGRLRAVSAGKTVVPMPPTSGVVVVPVVVVCVVVVVGAGVLTPPPGGGGGGGGDAVVNVRSAPVPPGEPTSA